MKEFKTVDDITKKKQEEESMERKIRVMNGMDNLMGNIKRKIEKRKEEERKNRTNFKKAVEVFVSALVCLILLDLTLGSIWLFIFLIKQII